MFENSILFCLFIFLILLNLQGIGTDEQVLVEILSSRSTKVSFGPCQLKQKIVMNLVHVSSPFTSGKGRSKILEYLERNTS